MVAILGSVINLQFDLIYTSPFTLFCHVKQYKSHHIKFQTFLEILLVLPNIRV